jgi:hypothetical protein
MADDERTDEPTDEGTDDERLEQVDEEIARARTEAEEAGILLDPDEPRFADSGTIAPDVDDQQIAPPG